MCEDSDFRDRMELFVDEINRLEQLYRVHIVSCNNKDGMVVSDRDETDLKKNVEMLCEWITRLANKKKDQV